MLYLLQRRALHCQWCSEKDATVAGTAAAMWLCAFVLVTVLSVDTVETSKCFCDYDNQVVMCSRSNLSEFRESDVFCEELSEIDLSENSLREYPNALRHFKSVNLSRNGIEVLDSSETQIVYFLDISENTLKQIDFADKFPLLELLNASINSLGVGNDDFLNGRCRLTHLDLSKNKIKSLQPVTKCAQLSALRATHNMISVLPDNFSVLRKLQYLSVSNNKLLHVSGFPRALKYLDISSNKLEEVDPVMFKGLSSLTDLNLKGNKISVLDRGALSRLPSLEKLHFERNKLTTVSSDSFLGLPSLKVLELSDNDIEFLRADAFSDLLNLEELSLDGNLLKSLPALRLGKKVLRLSFMLNLIKKIDISAILALFSGNPTKRVINLFLNPNSGNDPELPKLMRYFDYECLSDSLAEFTKHLLKDMYMLPRHQSYKMASTPCSLVRFFKGNHSFGISIDEAGVIHGYPWYVVAENTAQKYDFDNDEDNEYFDNNDELIHEEL